MILAKLYDYCYYYRQRIRTSIWRGVLRNDGNLSCWGRVNVLNARNIRFGRNITLNNDVYLNGQGGIKVGNNVAFSAGCKVISTGLNKSDLANGNKKHISIGVSIGSNVQVGAGAIILDGVVIGDNVIIAASAVVNKNVENNSIVAGIPAKKIAPLK